MRSIVASVIVANVARAISSTSASTVPSARPTGVASAGSARSSRRLEVLEQLDHVHQRQALARSPAKR